MNTATNKSPIERLARFQWIGELLVLVIAAPALVYSVLSLNNLPIV